ncbi:MAG: zinc-dependent peptidase [Pirellulaceae bacterium]
MIFSWFRNRRRKRLLASPIPIDWPQIMASAVRYFSLWPDEIQSRFRDAVRIIIHETNWEGCDGLKVTEEMKVVIASQAAMMLVGTEDYFFEGVQTFLVYPASFKRKTSDGLVVSETPRIGEAWHRGPIVLSWQDIHWITPGRNVVVHELAHHLDGLDGEIGGTPRLEGHARPSRWAAVSEMELARLRRDLNDGFQTFFDPYAATSLVEFFAVSSEAFFEAPRPFKVQHSDWFECLSDFYQVDPTRWSS